MKKWLVLASSILIFGCGGGNNNGGNIDPPAPPPPPPPVMCEWDDTITEDDPACVEPPRCEWDDTIYAEDPLCVEPPVCEWDDTIYFDDPGCVEPERCEWDSTIYFDDPLCVEPDPCPYDPTIYIDDPACVEPPPCELTVEWVNPTEDIDNEPLDPDELVAATVYFFSVPETPEAVDMMHAAEAYTLMFTYMGPWEDRDRSYFIWMTVSNLDIDGNPQESDVSNQVEKVCQ